LTGDAPPLSALLEAASMRSERGEHEQALPHLERALASSPEDSLVVDAIAESLSKLGRYRESPSSQLRKSQSDSDSRCAWASGSPLSRPRAMPTPSRKSTGLDPSPSRAGKESTTKTMMCSQLVARSEMKGRWKHPVAGMGWYRKAKRDFAALPDA
jgi:hypothetical protein